jgi:hypothetical protein
MTLRFWPEFPYVFRDYNRSIPKEEQTVEQATKAVQASYGRKIRKMKKRLMDQLKGGFTFTSPIHPASSEVQTQTSGDTHEESTTGNAIVRAEHISQSANDSGDASIADQLREV